MAYFKKIIWGILNRMPNVHVIFSLRNIFLRRFFYFEIDKNVKIGKNFQFPNSNFILKAKKGVIIGNNLKIRRDKKNNKKSYLIIGEETLILGGAFFDCSDNIKIGRDAHIGRNTKIYTHSHEHKNNTLSPKNQPVFSREVNLSDGVILYEESVIMPGVIIGDYSVIGLRAIVTKNFTEKGSIIVGMPGQLVGKRFEEKN